jgi:hypothetical protein
LALPIGEVLPNDDVLEYGFVARNATGGRVIAVGQSGTVSLTVRLPKPTVPALTPWKFVMKFVVVDEPITRVSRGILEDTASAAARASAVNASEVMLLGTDTDTVSGRTTLRVPHVRLSSLPNYMSQVGAFTFVRGYGDIVATQNTLLAARVPVVTGGTAPHSFTISPDLGANTGLSFDPATGQISGTATTVTTATTYTVTAQDSTGKTSTSRVAIRVIALPTLGGYSSINALRGVSLAAQTPTLTGGAAPFAYSIAPSLPTGLTLNSSTGVLSGSPSASQSTTDHTITVTDANGATASQALTVSVRERLGVQYPSNPQGTLDAAFSLTPTISNAVGNLTYSIDPTTLPAGLSFNASTGQISGTPTELLTRQFTISATDSGVPTDSSSSILTLEIKSLPTLAYNPTLAMTVGRSTNLSPVITGGAAPLTFTDRSSLPLSSVGLSLGANGQIVGTPNTVVTNQTFQVRLTDGSGKTADASFVLSVVASPQVSGYNDINARVGSNLPNVLPTVSGGAGTPTFGIDCLPALGLGVGTGAGAAFRTDTGTIQASPTSTIGELNCQVQVTDANGATGLSSAFVIRVFQVTGISISGATALVVGSSTTLSATVTGAPLPFVTSVNWSAECVLNTSGTACDTSKNVLDYVEINAATGVVNAKIGAGAKVRLRATSSADSSVFERHNMTFTGLVTLPI